nr:hypothetical protein BaRGS_001543 [Batillaria attramentaria]
MLRQDVQSGSITLKDKLSIELDPDMRHGHVRYDNYIFNAKLMDMPCIIESLKTVDKKTFYKTADISQMLVCSTDEDVNVEETESPKKKDKDRRYLCNQGITPPLKNVRKRRFRKTLKKKYMDQPELEKEVRRLFRYDAEAIDVKWEVLAEDEKPLSDADQTSGHVEASGTVTNTGGSLRRTDTSVSMDVASFFGELSSSEDEEDKDVNIMDSDDASRDPYTPRMGDTSMERAASESQGMEADADTAELQEKLNELVQQLEEIREKRLELESQMAEEDNDMMRASILTAGQFHKCS